MVIRKSYQGVRPPNFSYYRKSSKKSKMTGIQKPETALTASSSTSFISNLFTSDNSRKSRVSISSSTIEQEEIEQLEQGFHESTLILEKEPPLPSIEVAPGVFHPIGSRFKSLNEYMVSMERNRQFQEPLQKVAKQEKLVLPSVPDDEEKYAYVKTHYFPLLLYLIFSMLALTAGMWYAIVCNLLGYL